MTELKSCPFCGGEAVVDHYQWWDSYDPPNLHNTWQIGCASEATKEHCCIGRLCHSRGFKTKEEAIDAWNRRAEHTAKVVEDEFGHLLCSECGAMQPEDYETYYCWNCGARQMDEHATMEVG